MIIPFGDRYNTVLLHVIFASVMTYTHHSEYGDDNGGVLPSSVCINYPCATSAYVFCLTSHYLQLRVMSILVIVYYDAIQIRGQGISSNV